MGLWNILPVYQERSEEEADLIRGVEGFKSVHGEPPRGFISPRGTPSSDTVELLIKHNLKWHSDHFDRDVPYKIDCEFGDLIAVPFTMEVNDMPLYIRYGNEPEAFTRILERILDGFGDTHTPRAVLDLTVHAHVFGRPFGAIELRKSIEVLQRRENVWITTHEELADTVSLNTLWHFDLGKPLGWDFIANTGIARFFVQDRADSSELIAKSENIQETSLLIV